MDRLIILLAILLMVGNNYAFDIPQALEVPIEEEFQLTQTQFNLLYSVFAIPNIGLSIGGGIMIDNMGGRWGVSVYFQSFAGPIIIVYIFGGCYHNYCMMLCGRAIFGIASDILHIAVFKMVAQRMPKDMGTAMGLILTVPELAAALNSFLSPYLFEKTNSLKIPLLFGLFLCFWYNQKQFEQSFLSGLMMIYVDMKYEKVESVKQTEQISVFNFKLTKPFVIMSIITTLMLASYVPFLDNANKFYHERFGFSIMDAGQIVTVGYVVAAITSPVVGRISDKFTNYRPFLLQCQQSCFYIPFAILLYAFDDISKLLFSFCFDYIGVIIFMFSSVLMPALQSTVPEDMLATALGLLGIIENFCMAVVPMISGFVYAIGGGIDPMKNVDIIYLFLAGIGVVLSIHLLMENILKPAKAHSKLPNALDI